MMCFQAPKQTTIFSSFGDGSYVSANKAWFLLLSSRHGGVYLFISNYLFISIYRFIYQFSIYLFSMFFEWPMSGTGEKQEPLALGETVKDGRPQLSRKLGIVIALQIIYRTI